VSVSDIALDACTTCGDALKLLRRRARLSQRELSIATGYSESHISRIENNERSFDRHSLLALFVPALHLQDEPETVARWLALCTVSLPPQGDAPLSTVATSSAPEAHRSAPALPIQLTSFVGRVEEVTKLRDLLQRADVRLLTLTGAGGCGKTRLALRVAEMAAHRYEQGVRWVELAALDDPFLLPKVIAESWGLHQAAADDPLTTLTDYLRNRRLLLILDNCEHLAAAAATLATALLRACPALQILATSREALATPGEINYRVQPLALPPMQRGRQPLAAEVADYDAIQLFVERARLALPGFALSDHNTAAVVAICQRLDGIPLGIELAAAWLSVLSPTQIDSRLAQGFDLLVSAERTVLSRHQTLTAAIDWSYQLLAEEERTLLRRLAIFAGGWTLAAAEAVVATDEEGLPALTEHVVLSLLYRLVNKSLVVVDHLPTGDVRYRLLEPLRQYLAGKLAAAGETGVIRNRHLRFLCELAERLEAQTRGESQSAALAIFEGEQDNFRAALTWGLAEHGPSTAEQRTAAALAAALGRFWYMRQQWREGSEWLQKALARLIDEEHFASEQVAPEDCTLTAKVLFRVSTLTRDLTIAQRRIEQSLMLWRRVVDRRGMVRALQELGTIATEQGDYTRAADLLTEALVHARTLGDEWLIAISLGKLADLAGERNEYAQCESWASAYLALARRLGDIGMTITALNLLAQCALAADRATQAIDLLQEGLELDRRRDPQSQGGPWSFRNLGLAYQLLGDYVQAAACFRRSLHLRWERDDWGGMAWALEGLGEVAALTTRPIEAARLWGAAEALRRRAGSVMSASDDQRHAPLVAAVEQQLGAQAFQQAWQAGTDLTLAQLCAGC
jgi:predicted ATPase/transcriptional regulator with XRE-family HTH domain